MSSMETADLNEMSNAELHALRELSAGDATAAVFVNQIISALSTANQVTSEAKAQADRLMADDMSNPEGVAKRLSELPQNVEALTYTSRKIAGDAIAALEGLHGSRALAHDPANDAALTAELQNYTAGLKHGEAGVELIKLAANPRYSSMMAGPYGLSLAARFGVDPAALKRAAFQSIAQNGTPQQRKHAAAAMNLHKAVRALTLSQAGTEDKVKAMTNLRAPARRRGFGEAY